MAEADDFRSQIEALRPYLMRFASLQLRDSAAAEDAVQEALLAALAGQASFAGRANQTGDWDRRPPVEPYRQVGAARGDDARLAGVGQEFGQTDRSRREGREVGKDPSAHEHVLDESGQRDKAGTGRSGGLQSRGVVDRAGGRRQDDVGSGHRPSYRLRRLGARRHDRHGDRDRRIGSGSRWAKSGTSTRSGISGSGRLAVCRMCDSCSTSVHSNDRFDP